MNDNLNLHLFLEKKNQLIALLSGENKWCILDMFMLESKIHWDFIINTDLVARKLAKLSLFPLEIDNFVITLTNSTVTFILFAAAIHAANIISNDAIAQMTLEKRFNSSSDQILSLDDIREEAFRLLEQANHIFTDTLLFQIGLQFKSIIFKNPTYHEIFNNLITDYILEEIRLGHVSDEFLLFLSKLLDIS